MIYTRIGKEKLFSDTVFLFSGVLFVDWYDCDVVAAAVETLDYLRGDGYLFAGFPVADGSGACAHDTCNHLHVLVSGA